MHAKFSKKYPIRFRHQKRIKVGRSVRYNITLVSSTGKISNLHSFTWEKLNGFDPKQERRLLTKDLRLTILERDNNTCQSCGYHAVGRQMHIDHIIPVSKGGKTVESNLQVLCANCNMAKGAN